jgi:hypothetical protein
MKMERKRLSLRFLVAATVISLCSGCDTIKSWDREERDRDLRRLHQGTAVHQEPSEQMPCVHERCDQPAFLCGIGARTLAGIIERCVLTKPSTTPKVGLEVAHG